MYNMYIYLLVYAFNSKDLICDVFEKILIFVIIHKIPYAICTYRLMKFKKLVFQKVLDNYGLQIVKVSCDLEIIDVTVVETPWIYPSISFH